MKEAKIEAKGVRVNNLKNVDVEIPRGKLIVVTGLSGSGKSSLAFDTLYAEGQRRYVESLSSYARQFLGRLPKPDADFIRGLPPAIAIEQRVNTRNPRSTVGTSTEIYDYLRLLYARVGRTISPVSGQEVKKHTENDVVARAYSYPVGTRIALASPIQLPPRRKWASQMEIFMQEGYSRLIDPATGHIIEIGDPEAVEGVGLQLLVDRMTVNPDDADETSRLADSAETAFFEGHDSLTLLAWNGSDAPEASVFSRRFEADGLTFVEPSDALFNFNNPYGACSRCEGFGRTMGINERLVVPNPSLSVYDDAVVCWRGEKMSEWKRWCIREAASAGFPIHKPYAELTPEQRQWLWRGNGRWEGIDGFFNMVESQRHKIQYRVMAARYRGKTMCPVCQGRRLRKEALWVKIGGRSIADLVVMPVKELRQWFDNLELDGNEAIVAKRLLKEIRSRLEFLDDVGLGYLTLDRLSSTLSGGESQRISLATQLGSSLVGSLYILDEPSIGLHSRDTRRLLDVLRKLQQAGNTVIIVEHDEEIMREADWIIDVGPDAGRLGGEVIYQGPVEGIMNVEGSHTADYLTGRRSIGSDRKRRKWRNKVTVTGVRQHNLKNVTVDIPLGVMTAVTGVSGSGKSSLVRDVVFHALQRRLGEGGADSPGAFKELRGDIDKLAGVEFVDQNPIGKSSRSNPATYLKAYDEIRRLFADRQASKQMGFTPAHFSFNTEGGRCEECKGEGTITIEMQFMADITMECEACRGKRFKRDILEVEWRGRNIADVLDMTVVEAILFFSEDPEGKKVAKRLQPLADVGLGYIKLGQSSSTLSGGENQRVKLAYYLAMDSAQPTMFIFDEPTTGLHFHDIVTLIDSFDRLIAKGHTVVVIEHNPDVIFCADYVIDIGPEGGEAGGSIVATGTPEQIMACPASHTGKALRRNH